MPGILNYDPESWRRPQRGLMGNGTWGATGLSAGFFPSSQPFQADPNMGRRPDLPYDPVNGPAGPPKTNMLPIMDPIRFPRGSGEGWESSEGPSSTNDGTYSGPNWAQPAYGSVGDWASTAFPELYDDWQGLNGWEKTQHRENAGDPWTNVYYREKPPPWAGFLDGLKTMMGYTPGGLAMKGINGVATAMGKPLAGLAPIQTPSVQTSGATTTGSSYGGDSFAGMGDLLQSLEGTTPGDTGPYWDENLQREQFGGQTGRDYFTELLARDQAGQPASVAPVSSSPLPQMSEQDMMAALEQMRSEGYAEDIPIDEQEWARNWNEETGEEWWTRG